MAESSWPTIAGGRAVNDIQWEAMAAQFCSDGIVGSPADAAAVYADSTGRQAKIRANIYAVVRGRGWTSGNGIILPMAANTSGSDRIDSVVLRLDRTTWEIHAAIKQGSPAGTPLPPTLQQDYDLSNPGVGLWEVALADVQADKNYTTVNPADVADRSYLLTKSPVAVRGLNDALTGRSLTEHQGSIGQVVWDNGLPGLVVDTGSPGFKPVMFDSGPLTASIASGWSGALNYVRRVNGFVWAQFQLQRTGANIAPGTDTLALTVPTGCAPVQQVDLVAYGVGGQVVRGRLDAGTGKMSVTDFPATITTGGTLSFHAAVWMSDSSIWSV